MRVTLACAVFCVAALAVGEAAIHHVTGRPVENHHDHSKPQTPPRPNRPHRPGGDNEDDFINAFNDTFGHCGGNGGGGAGGEIGGGDVGGDAGGEIGGGAGGEIGGGVGGDVGGDAGGEIGGGVGGGAGGEIGGGVGGDVGGDVGGEIGGDIGGDAGGEIGGDVSGDIGGDISGDVGGEIGGDIGEDVQAGEWKWVSGIAGTIPYRCTFVYGGGHNRLIYVGRSPEQNLPAAIHHYGQGGTEVARFLNEDLVITQTQIQWLCADSGVGWIRVKDLTQASLDGANAISIGIDSQTGKPHVACIVHSFYNDEYPATVGQVRDEDCVFEVKGKIVKSSDFAFWHTTEVLGVVNA